MKVWCEACNGKGYVKLDEYSENNGKGYIGEGSCPYCNGKGYREQNQPTTEINIDYYEELKRKAEIGDAIMKWFYSGRFVELYDVEIRNPRKLIEWAKNYNESEV